MKKILCLTLFAMFLLLSYSAVFAAQKQDVVYLKNGSIIRGEIVEQIPNVSIKIETKDGSVFVYKMSEVEKITKEEAKAGAEPAEEAKAPAGDRTLAGNPERQFALLINPLGFLQFGPQVDFEIKLAPSTYLLLVGRWHAGGLLSYVISDSIHIDQVAFGGGARYFFRTPETPDALVMGFQVQYGFGTFGGDAGYASEYTGTSSYLAGALETGYRWRFNKFIMETGVIYGVSTDLTTVQWPPSDPSNKTQNPKKTIPFGMLELLFGMEF